MKPLLMDKRGHEGIRKLLYDIGEDTILDSGDISFKTPDGTTCLIEIKEVGDLLNSISSGRLHDQCVRMFRASPNMSFLIRQGKISSTNDGFLVVGLHITGWKFSSVQGVIVDLAMKGIITLDSTSDYTTALTIRTIYNQSMMTNGRVQIRTPKMFHLNSDTESQERVLSSFPGINLVTAQALLQRFHTLRRIFTATPGELMDCSGVGQSRVKTITDVLDKW